MKNLILIGSFLLCAVLVYGQKISKEQYKNLNDGVKLFVGDFSNKAQADTAKSPLYPEQIIRGRLLSYGHKNEKWLHLAWFHPKNNIKTLDQRLFRFRALEDGRIEAQVFYVPKEGLLENSWELNMKLFDPKTLQQDACALRFINNEKGEFELLSSEPYCLSEAGVILYHSVAVHFKVSKSRFSMYSNFYDEYGNLLFGYPEGSHFRQL